MKSELAQKSGRRPGLGPWFHGIGCPFAIVFCLLVGFAVYGRLHQPTWNFTPTAAVAFFSGYFFSRKWVAVLVPFAALMISNHLLNSPYNSYGVMITVYLSFLAPVALGVFLAKKPTAFRMCLGALAPSLIFFFTTNFAVWFFSSGYATNWAGLMQCYVNGLLFYRLMLYGDLFYVAIVFGTYALAANLGSLPWVRARESVKAGR